MQTQNWLGIRQRPKVIPYPNSGGIRQDDGSENHGFKLLKGRTEDVSLIPEAQDEPHLRKALIALNQSDTGIFTVGCEKSFNIDDNKQHWARGYIEFAINDKDVVCDAQNYFKVFYEFSRQIHSQQFDHPVQFRWELEPAQFTEADCSGFTATVSIQIGDHANKEQVYEIWARALAFLTDHLCSFGEKEPPNHIYGPR